MSTEIEVEVEDATAITELANFKADIARVEAEELEGDLKLLYDLVSKKVRETIAKQRFTPELLRPLLLQIIQVVQEFSNETTAIIDGSIKRTMALDIAKHVVADLHKQGQMGDEIYEYLMISLELAGPALMDGLKALYSKLVSTTVDISEHGCSGCCKRNCCVQ